MATTKLMHAMVAMVTVLCLLYHLFQFCIMKGPIYCKYTLPGANVQETSNEMCLNKVQIELT